MCMVWRIEFQDPSRTRFEKSSDDGSRAQSRHHSFLDEVCVKCFKVHSKEIIDTATVRATCWEAGQTRIYWCISRKPPTAKTPNKQKPQNSN